MARKENNSLAESHREIAKESDGWDPDAMTPLSGKERSWRCKVGPTLLENFSSTTYFQFLIDDNCFLSNQ